LIPGCISYISAAGITELNIILSAIPLTRLYVVIGKSDAVGVNSFPNFSFPRRASNRELLVVPSMYLLMSGKTLQVEKHLRRARPWRRTGSRTCLIILRFLRSFFRLQVVGRGKLCCYRHIISPFFSSVQLSTAGSFFRAENVRAFALITEQRVVVWVEIRVFAGGAEGLASVTTEVQ